MDFMVDSETSLAITFKFGGYWAHIKNQARKKYTGGKQKTVQFEKESLSFDVIKDKIESICPWLKGHNFELFHHICGSSPKVYTFISSNIEVMDMIEQCSKDGRIEIVVITQDVRDLDVCSHDQQVDDRSSMLDSYNESFELNECKELVVGARFQDALAFKHVLRTNSIMNNFGVKIQASNKKRVVAICAHHGCPWRVHASLCKDGQTFEVRKLQQTHFCPAVNRAGNRQATSSWVAEEIAEVVRRNPDITPKQLNDNLETSYGLSLPYMKLWRAREAARTNIFGDVDDSYHWVPTLQSELLKRNPGSHITYSYCRQDFSFKRFFISFKVSIDGFLVGCRPLIGLDACHLKSKYLGVLLSANSLDGNNGLYTVAFAIAESESKKTWTWFLENLACSIGFTWQNLAFISDMEKGLAEAMQLIFPTAEHRVCLRHLWKNLKKNFLRHDGKHIGSLVWSAANALTKYTFDAKMNELSCISPQVHDYLRSLPYKWSKSDFSLEIKNYYNTNNMAESFNAWVGEARSKSVIDLVAIVRGKMMEQRADRKVISSTWRGELVPYANEYIREITTRKEQFLVRQSTPNRAEVEGLQETHEVDLQDKACSCQGWQMSGLPCIHAATFIGLKEHPLWHIYVHESYTIMRYRMAYEGPIATLPGKEQWNLVEDGVLVGPPKTLRPRGRPKKRRIKNFLENSNKKSRNVHKCGRCGQ